MTGISPTATDPATAEPLFVSRGANTLLSTTGCATICRCRALAALEAHSTQRRGLCKAMTNGNCRSPHEGLRREWVNGPYRSPILPRFAAEILPWKLRARTT